MAEKEKEEIGAVKSHRLATLPSREGPFHRPEEKQYHGLKGKKQKAKGKREKDRQARKISEGNKSTK